MEKLYFVAEGEIAVVGELDGVQQRDVLFRFDSCRFAPGEARQLINNSNLPALVLLVMANQPPTD